MTTDQEFAAWAALADPALPAAHMVRIAVDGHPGQVLHLCDNPALPVDVMLLLVHRTDPLAAGLLLGRDVPTEVVSAVLETHPELAESARGHWAAPVAVKMTVPLREMSGVALDAFLVAVRATPAERTAMRAAFEQGSSRTVGEVWRDLRPV